MATPPIKICLVLTLFSSIKPLHQLNSYALLYSFMRSLSCSLSLFFNAFNDKRLNFR
ncbi:hypothetical protein HPHPH16_0984 [Helicobacter pylori Hp H-16]|nr:hypothetical protein HPHPH16_0984 [Helicobacter pylori Hp H-16]